MLFAKGEILLKQYTVTVSHLPFTFYPDPVGGTEVYVRSLIENLGLLGIRSVVVAPGSVAASYNWRGIEVHRYSVNADLSKDEMYGRGDRLATETCLRILDKVKPDLVHVHAFTSGVSLGIVEELKARGVPVVFTYHTPTVSCMRGDLLKFGRTVCDGRLNLNACSVCTLHGHGLPRLLASIYAGTPIWILRPLENLLPSRRLRLLARWKRLIKIRHDAVRKLFGLVDHTVVVCEWTAELLKQNGLLSAHSSIIRHGVPQQETSELFRLREVPSKFTDMAPLKLLYLGRISPEKGIDRVIAAMADLNAPFELDIYGMSDPRDEYATELKAIAARCQRVKFRSPVHADEVTSLMRSYHALMVPSVCLETGPLVVLEAFHAGLPVLGSALGGIMEWVRDGVDGLLVNPARDEWLAVVLRILEDPDLLRSLQEGVQRPPTFVEIARRHATIYHELFSNEAAVLPTEAQ